MLPGLIPASLLLVLVPGVSATLLRKVSPVPLAIRPDSAMPPTPAGPVPVPEGELISATVVVTPAPVVAAEGELVLAARAADGLVPVPGVLPVVPVSVPMLPLPVCGLTDDFAAGVGAPTSS